MQRTNMPAYRRKESKGYVYAMVRLFDAVTGRQQDVMIGEYGTRESRDQYMKELAAWEERGRRLDEPPPKPKAAPTDDYEGELPDGIAVVELVEKYDAHAKVYYGKSEYILIGRAWDALIEKFGRTAAANFGPKKLRDVREGMVQRDWARKTIIRRDFGLEASQIILGHSSAQVTDAVYAERDTLKAKAIIQKIG